MSIFYQKTQYELFLYVQSLYIAETPMYGYECLQYLKTKEGADIEVIVFHTLYHDDHDARLQKPIPQYEEQMIADMGKLGYPVVQVCSFAMDLGLPRHPSISSEIVELFVKLHKDCCGRNSKECIRTKAG